MSGIALYLHPVAALATLVLGAHIATLGLRSRSGRPGSALLRRRHARLGPWLFALVVVNWIGGLGVVATLRDDLDVATSGHFLVGSLVLLLFTAAALLSRWIGVSRVARSLHPAVGASALLLSCVQVFLGLQLLP